MAIDLDALSKTELQELERAIAQRERRLEEERLEAALSEVRAVAERYGLPLESIVGGARAKKRSGVKGNGKGEGAAPRSRVLRHGTVTPRTRRSPGRAEGASRAGSSTPSPPVRRPRT